MAQGAYLVAGSTWPSDCSEVNGTACKRSLMAPSRSIIAIGHLRCNNHDDRRTCGDQACLGNVQFWQSSHYITLGLVVGAYLALDIRLKLTFCFPPTICETVQFHCC